MKAISRLEQAGSLDKIVTAAQRPTRIIRPGRVRNGLHGVRLGHPLHPLLVQAAAGTWLSASIVDLVSGDETAARRLTAAGLAASEPAIAAGAAGIGGYGCARLRMARIARAGPRSPGSRSFLGQAAPASAR
jgi:hypothetical protein